MSLRRTLAITRRILRQFRHDRRTLALLFVAPILILALIGYLLRGGGGHTAMGVVNLDSGPLGERVTSAVVASSHVDATRMDVATASDRLRQGTISGYIVLPANFSERAQKEARLEPEVDLDGTQPSASADVLQALNLGLAAAAGGAVKISPQVHRLHGGSGLDTLDYFGAAFIGLILFFLIFVVTSVAFLRERSQGTLERLMASPLRRSEIVVGYMLGFTAVALVQGVIVLVFALYVLRVHNEGNVLLVFLVEALLAVGAVNLGIFLSMFARTEFQAVQFIPLVLLPQVLLSGILFPVLSEPVPLQYVSAVLPLTYAVDGLRDVMLKGVGLESSSLRVELAFGLGFALLAVLAAGSTLRRRQD